MKKLKLNSGFEIPVLGFGTWQAENGEESYNAVRNALEAGYRHIDTAAAYDNEESVGKAMLDSGIKREDIFLTSKLWNDIRGYEETKEAINESLRKLNTPYLDLYLIHWPRPHKYHDDYIIKNIESWKAMEEAVKEGKIKSIGVSNFLIHHLEELLPHISIMPAVNQIKLHVGLNQNELEEYCIKKNIAIEAYSPLGTGKILTSDTLIHMAKKYQKSPAQIAIKYQIAKGRIVIVKSVTLQRIKDNFNVFDFELKEDDIHILDEAENVSAPLKDIDNILY